MKSFVECSNIINGFYCEFPNVITRHKISCRDSKATSQLNTTTKTLLQMEA